MIMGLSVNECLHSKKPENEIDLCISSGCGDFKGQTRFRQSLLKISSIIILILILILRNETEARRVNSFM